MSRLIGNYRPGRPGAGDDVAVVGRLLTVPGVPAERLWGVGVDLIDQQRFALAARRIGPAFLRRVFDDSEWTGTIPEAAELATLGRHFGIKESVVKVAGGLPPGARYRDILVGSVAAIGGIQRAGEIGDAGGTGWGVRAIGLRGALARWAEEEQVSLLGGVLDSGLPSAGPNLCWAVAVREQATTAGADQWSA